MALQTRVNGALGEAVGDPYVAALVSFGSGLVVLVLASLILPAGRRGAAALPGALRARTVRWWYLLAGVFGAFLVVVQTLTVGVLGVSVFILGLVVGQSLGGLVVDRAGIGPGGPRRFSRNRMVGTAIVVVSVLVAMTPRFSLGDLHLSPAVMVGFALLPVLSGGLTSVQTAWNASIAAHAGTPITSTLTNFSSGTVGLVVTVLVTRVLTHHQPLTWPHNVWLYTGGLLGIVFVAAGAVLARHVGVLQTSLGLVTGMLLGALALDIAVPTPATVVTPVTVMGTLVTVLGLVVVTLPRPTSRAATSRRSGSAR